VGAGDVRRWRSDLSERTRRLLITAAIADGYGALRIAALSTSSIDRQARRETGDE
jgi:hypothetical protein